MVKAPPWLKIGGKGARERAGGELPSWYNRKENRPRVVRQEPDGATIEAVARMLASRTKSARKGERRGAVAVVRMLMGRDVYKRQVFDFVISTEVLEHDPEWWVTLDEMCKRVRPGGSLLVTCAGPGRAEHGTRRCPVGGMVCDSDYYLNLSVVHLLSVVSKHPRCV